MEDKRKRPAKLTALKIDQLLKRKTPGDYHDQDAVGIALRGRLLLRVYASGKASWFVTYHDPHTGKSGNRKKIGNCPALGLADARKAAGRYLESIANPGQQAEPDELTFGALCKGYLASIKPPEGWKQHDPLEKGQVSLKTYKNKQMFFDVHLQKLAGMHPSAITKEVFRETVAQAYPDKLNAAYKLSSMVHSVFEYGYAKDLYKGENPARKFKASLETPPVRHVYIPVDPLQVMLQSVEKGELKPQFALIFKVLVFTAQRLGNVLQMRWQDLHLGKGPECTGKTRWIIPRQRMKIKNKSRPPHLVPLPKGLAVELKRWKELTNGGVYSDFVFPSNHKANRSGHYTGNTIRDTFYGAFKPHLPEDAQEWNVHDLRAMTRTNMSELGQREDIAPLIIDHPARSRAEDESDKPYNMSQFEFEKACILEVIYYYYSAIALGLGEEFMESTEKIREQGMIFSPSHAQETYNRLKQQHSAVQ